MNAAASPHAPASLTEVIAHEIHRAGGWLPFDRFMHLALYAPGLGYYARDARQFGPLARDGSDFVTAPELSPLFGRTLAAQVAQALQQSGSREIWEFGAGSGALAGQVLQELARLGQPAVRYTIVDVSAALRARQQARLAAHGGVVRWAGALPPALSGVVIGNEVLDAMPVKLLARAGGAWHERGIALSETFTVTTNTEPGMAAIEKGLHHGPRPFIWADRPTALRPPLEIPDEHDVVTEIHPQQRAFIATLAERLRAGTGGAAFFIDYGFPQAEYYHPQRDMGTLVCHRAHRVDDDPLTDVGEKDITAHVDFTGIALTAQDAGLAVLGYTSQARFLLNCGIARHMQAADLPARATAMKLLAEHEMGELFKVIGLATGPGWPALGFAQGDRCHRL
ncbi:MAG: SAM-dependent methyltransferase [Burkholderiaceae bacterium]|jgi:SAM-dependent MidA family methyltransferase|nr:SAM-dependent methyltransferase [Burkholderiaceae bacterium]